MGTAIATLCAAHGYEVAPAITTPRCLRVFQAALCVPKTLSALIRGGNRLTSAHHDRAAMFRAGRLGRAVQVEEPA